ncbi:putative cation-transporting ATPase F [Nucleospora cyclopteri]
MYHLIENVSIKFVVCLMPMEPERVCLDEILDHYNISSSGMDFVGMSEEERSKKERRNYSVSKKNKSLIMQYVYVLTEPMNALLIASSIGLGILYLLDRDEKMHLSVIFFTLLIMLINISIELFHENRFEKFFRDNQKSFKCRVNVGSTKKLLWKEDLVEGDILDLRKGDVVGADARIIANFNVKVDNSEISNSTKLLSKTVSPIEDKTVDEAENMVLQSNLIISGRALAVVVAVGEKTVIGKRIKKSFIKPRKECILYNDMSIFFKGSFFIATFLSVLLLVISFGTGHNIVFTFNVAIGLYIGILPEGIPSTVKLLMYESFYKLRERNILIRGFDALGNLSLMDYLCVNKNEILTEQLLFCNSIYDGYDINDIQLTFVEQNQLQLHNFCIYASIISNMHHKSAKENYKIEIEDQNILNSLEIFKQVCIDFFIVLKGFDKNKNYILSRNTKYIKKCKYKIINGEKVKMDNRERNKTKKAYKEMIKKGEKTIFLCSKDKGNNKLELMCVFGLRDIPKSGIKITNNILKTAGIKLSMITGDNWLQSVKVGEECMNIKPFTFENSSNSNFNKAPSNNSFSNNQPILTSNDTAKSTIITLHSSKINKYENNPVKPFDQKIISNSQFEGFSHIEKAQFLANPAVAITRIKWKERHEFIEVLLKNFQVVGYFGARIDDCTALNTADLGFCLNEAPDSCKQTSSLILSKYQDLIFSIEEGRLYFSNLQKAIKYITMHIAPQVIPLTISIVLGTPLAISAILLLFMDLLVEIFPALFFAFEEPEINLIEQKPEIRYEKVEEEDEKTAIDTNIEVIAQGRTNSVAQNNRNHFSTNIINLLSSLLQLKTSFFRILRPHEGIYSREIIRWSFLEAGMLATFGCLLGFFLSLHLSNIPMRYFVFSSQKYFKHGAKTITMNEREIDAEEQLHSLYVAQSTYFIGLIICQFCNMLVCRRKYNYFFANFFNNPLLLLSSSAGIIITVLIVYTKYFEDILIIRRPSLLALLAPVGSGILILALDTYKKYIRKINKS